MNARRLFAAVALACTGSIVSWSVVTVAASGSMASAGSYALQPTTAGAGGTLMHGGTWTLDGTIAQPTTIVQDGAGGLHLKGGFWQATHSSTANDLIFSNGFDQ